MGTHSHLTAAPRHLAHHHQPQENRQEICLPQEKAPLLEIHPLHRCLEIHLSRQFHQFHLRILGREYHRQGGLYLWVINLLQGPLYLQVLL